MLVVSYRTLLRPLIISVLHNSVKVAERTLNRLIEHMIFLNMTLGWNSPKVNICMVIVWHEPTGDGFVINGSRKQLQ